VQIICFGWVWGIEKGRAELDQGALIKIPGIFFFVMKYVAPLYLLVILIGFSWQNLPAYLKNLANEPVAIGTMALIAVIAVLLLLMVRVGERRWRAAGLDIDDDNPLKEPGP
jgi:hypothetical protein